MKSFVYNNTSCVNEKDELKLIIYYKTSNVKRTFSRNNETSKLPKLQRSHLIYEYKCFYVKCGRLNNSYVGMTSTTLSRRLTVHLQGGAPLEHTRRSHNGTLTRDVIVSNTNIIKSETDQLRLPVLKAAPIQSLVSTINTQA